MSGTFFGFVIMKLFTHFTDFLISQISDVRRLMPMVLFVEILRVENILLNTFRWKRLLHGLAFGLVIKVRHGDDQTLYVRTIEYGTLNGMHKYVCSNMSQSHCIESCLHDVAFTRDDWLVYRTTHPSIKRRNRLIMDAKKKMSEIFNEWKDGIGMEYQVVSCYLCRAEGSNHVESSAHGCNTDWLQDAVNSTCQDPCSDKMFSIAGISDFMDLDSSTQRNWTETEQTRFVNCLPGISFDTNRKTVSKLSGSALYSRVSGSPRVRVFRKNSDVINTLGPIIRAVYSGDNSLKEVVNNVTHQTKRRRVSLNLRVIKPLSMTLDTHQTSIIMRDNTDTTRISFGQRIPQNLKDIMRKELVENGKIRMLSHRNNQFRVLWNSFDNDTGK